MSAPFTCSLILLAAGAPDPSLLAPGPHELELALDRARTAVMEAESLATAVTRLENRIGEWRARRAPLDKCEPPEAESILGRIPFFLSAYRDGVQNARSKLARLSRVSVAPTVTPVLSPKASEEIKSFHARIDGLIRTYLEALAWHRHYVVPLIRACAPELLAQKEPGLSGPGKRDYVAVMGLGGGRLCPIGAPADGRVVAVAKGLACYEPAGGECTCAPVRVDPGAILGPAVTASAAPALAAVVEPLSVDAGVSDAGLLRFRRVPASTSTSALPVVPEVADASSATKAPEQEDLEVPKVEMEPFPPAEALTTTVTPKSE